jgi:hypothetical protein
MPLNIKYLIFLLLLSLKGISQESTVLSIYYGSNVHSLTSNQKKSIDSLLNSHAFESIELIGFADTVGNKKANLKISKLRAGNIESYIHLKIPTASISSSANGEQDQRNAKNDLKNQRRVDIIMNLTSIETIEISQEKIVEVNQQNNKKILKKEILSPKRKFKEDLLSQDKIIVENLLFEPGKTIFLYDKIPNELYYLADLMDSIQPLVPLNNIIGCKNNIKPII